MLKQTEFGDKSRRYYLTRTEEYVDGLKAALGIWCAAQASDKRCSLQAMTLLACGKACP